LAKAVQFQKKGELACLKQQKAIAPRQNQRRGNNPLISLKQQRLLHCQEKQKKTKPIKHNNQEAETSILKTYDAINSKPFRSARLLGSLPKGLRKEVFSLTRKKTQKNLANTKKKPFKKACEKCV
jgi:hypothetical protein